MHTLNRSENIHLLCHLKGCQSHLGCPLLLVELGICVLSIAVHQNHVAQLLKCRFVNLSKSYTLHPIG